ncbi:MAG: DUF1493 family protein [Pseudomonadota bacterium]
MSVREEILNLAAQMSGQAKDLIDASDVLGSCHLEGDDATEFLEAFAQKFRADMSTLQWEYHFKADEPPPKHRRVLPISKDGTVIPFQPITLDDLESAALEGGWVYQYPDYEIRIFWLYRPWVWVALCVLGAGSLLTISVLAGL